MYLIAVICPPLAVLMCGKPFQAIVACFLCLLIWFPGVIHACLVVADYKANERNRLMINAMRGNRRDDRDDDRPARRERPGGGNPFDFS